MGKLSSRDRKLAHVAGQNVSNVENRNFAPMSVALGQGLLAAPLQVTPTTGIVATAQTVYWCYVGCTQKTVTVDYVKFCQTVVAAGTTQVAQIALASTTSGPDGSAKTFTVLKVDNTLDDLKATTAATGVVRGNTTAMDFKVSPCTHLWVAARFDMTTAPTQPAILGCALDLGRGFIQTTASVTSPMVAGDSKVGVVPTVAIATTAQSLYLWGVANP